MKTICTPPLRRGSSVGLNSWFKFPDHTKGFCCRWFDSVWRLPRKACNVLVLASQSRPSHGQAKRLTVDVEGEEESATVLLPGLKECLGNSTGRWAASRGLTSGRWYVWVEYEVGD